MPIIQSSGALQSFTDPVKYSGGFGTGGSIDVYGLYAQSYAHIFSTQPNVRTCVDFLARNIADLSLHAYRRVNDLDRVRLADHDVIAWLHHPNASTTRYRLIESLVGDLGIYFNAYWLKVPYATRAGRRAIGLVRLPAGEVQVIGGLLPGFYRWTNHGVVKDFAPWQVVRFDGYNPLSPLFGLSPLETLRGRLAEEAAAQEHREAYWRHASRMDGVIERPQTAPKWTPEQKKEWRRQWQERYGGSAGTGQVAVLEDGMTFKPVSFSPKDSEYLSARKLSREECAAAYHIPLPMVGILDHATFSNIREQHKQLYQDTLGPWLTKIRLELEMQLLPESNDDADVYLLFNLQQKLAGSFEEQSTSLYQATGRPWMTANEARARLNLPRITDDPSADRLASQQGGPAGSTPTGTAPATPPDDDNVIDAQVVDVFEITQQRQHQRLQRLPAQDRANTFAAQLDRWNQELVADLAPLIGFDRARQRAEAFNMRQLHALLQLQVAA